MSTRFFVRPWFSYRAFCGMKLPGDSQTTPAGVNNGLHRTFSRSSGGAPKYLLWNPRRWLSLFSGFARIQCETEVSCGIGWNFPKKVWQNGSIGRKLPRFWNRFNAVLIDILFRLVSIRIGSRMFDNGFWSAWSRLWVAVQLQKPIVECKYRTRTSLDTHRILFRNGGSNDHDFLNEVYESRIFLTHCSMRARVSTFSGDR